MGYLTQIIRGQLNNSQNSPLASPSCAKPKNFRNLIATITPPLALLLTLIATNSQAAPPAAKSASSLGVVLGNAQGRLVVVRLTAPVGLIGLQVGDQIVAVDGHLVSTEAAFMQRLSAARPSANGISVTLARRGVRQIVNVMSAAGSSSRPRISGFVDPTQLVLTSQGVMHRDAAARLGLPGIPINGTPDRPPFERPTPNQ